MGQISRLICSLYAVERQKPFFAQFGQLKKNFFLVFSNPPEKLFMIFGLCALWVSPYRTPIGSTVYCSTALLSVPVLRYCSVPRAQFTCACALFSHQCTVENILTQMDDTLMAGDKRSKMVSKTEMSLFNEITYIYYE